MQLGNTPDFPIDYLGAIAAGLVPIPTSSHLTTGEVARIIDVLRPAAILSAPDVASAPHPRVIDLDALRAMRDLSPCAYDIGEPDRLAYVIYTSGTSGQLRAAGHAHRAIWALQMMIRGWYGLGPDDRLMHASAFNWTYTLGTGLMDPWTMGATSLIAEPGTDLCQLPALMAENEVSIFTATQGVYRKILNQAAMPRMPRLRHGLSAGEKLSHPVRAAWNAATGTLIYETYGMPECSTFVSVSPDYPAHDDCIGRPQPGRRVVIVDPEGMPLPLGDDGIIAVHKRGPGLMLGYLNAPEEIAARFRGEWFLTGDRWVMAKDGLITCLGRNDDMMNAGGYRVSPMEVEAALSQHEGIDHVGVTEVAFKDDVRAIAAFYTGPVPITEDNLWDFAETRLARYKRPRIYVHLDELLTGANGKLLRRALRAHYQARPQ